MVVLLVAINGFFGRKASKKAISAVALVFCGAAFAVALWIALRFFGASLATTG